MASSVNTVVLSGRLGQDPELRYTANGKAVCNLSLAVTGFASGDAKPPTYWINVAVWGKTAEICNEYTRKGSQVAIEGRITTRNYEDNAGNKRTATEVVAERVTLLDSKTKDEQGGSQAQGGSRGGQQQKKQESVSDWGEVDMAEVPF